MAVEGDECMGGEGDIGFVLRDTEDQNLGLRVRLLFNVREVFSH